MISSMVTLTWTSWPKKRRSKKSWTKPWRKSKGGRQKSAYAKDVQARDTLRAIKSYAKDASLSKQSVTSLTLRYLIEIDKCTHCGRETITEEVFAQFWNILILGAV